MSQVTRRENVLVGSAAIVAAIISTVLLVAPVYASQSTTIGGEGPTTSASSRTLLAVNGTSVLIALLLPILLAALPLTAQRHPMRRRVTVTCAALLLVFCLVSGFTIGLFYLPAAFLLFLSTSGKSNQPADTT